MRWMSRCPCWAAPWGKVYVLDRDKDSVLAGSQAAEPMVLHVNVGDCIAVRLTNDTTQGSVSFHVDMLAFDPKGVSGCGGRCESSPGRWARGDPHIHLLRSPRGGRDCRAGPGLGERVGEPGPGPLRRNHRRPSGRGLHQSWYQRGPVRGLQLASGCPSPSGESYRDFTLFIQGEDEVIGTHIMPYTEQVEGVVGLNYRAEPRSDRLSSDGDPAKLFMSGVHGDPATPLMEALVGDRVQVHVLVPFSEQAHVFSIEGHRWPVEPLRDGSDLLSAVQVGGSEAITLVLDHGAGGRAGIPGDYLYGDHREPYREAGLWGLFRVYPLGATDVGLLPLE